MASKYNQGLLVRRHQHHSYDFTAKMEFAPRDYCHMAGLVCYYNYDNNYYLNMSVDDEGKPYVMVNVSVNKEISQSEKVYLGENKDPVYLKAEVRERNVTFFVSQDGTSYTQVGEVLDMRNLSMNGWTEMDLPAMVGVTCQIFMGMGSRQTLNGWITACAESN
ncbi:MAG: hypothetical protein ACLT4E_04630 [Clostridium sp.]